MPTYETRPLEITQGATKKFTFALSPVRDLTGATITLMVKNRLGEDAPPILELHPDDDLSDYVHGSCTVLMLPENTETLEARSYFYHLKIEFSEQEIYYPLVGDFIIYRKA